MNWKNLILVLMLLVVMLISAQEVPQAEGEPEEGEDADMEVEEASEEYFAPEILGEGVVLADPDSQPVDQAPEDPDAPAFAPAAHQALRDEV